MNKDKSSNSTVIGNELRLIRTILHIFVGLHLTDTGAFVIAGLWFFTPLFVGMVVKIQSHHHHSRPPDSQ